MIFACHAQLIGCLLVWDKFWIGLCIPNRTRDKGRVEIKPEITLFYFILISATAVSIIFTYWRMGLHGGCGPRQQAGG